MHSKQHVGILSIIPFLVPGSQSSLQFENGTLRITDEKLYENKCIGYDTNALSRKERCTLYEAYI